MSKQASKAASAVDPKKVNSELFTLTYGALVAQLIKDYEEDDAVNKQLDKIGFNIGVRIIDDFLAKNAAVGRCHDFHEVAEVVAKQALKLYLGVTASVSNWSPAGDECSLVLDSNPLIEFVELPADQPHADLRYSQVLCGALRGALEQVQMECSCWFVQDQLRGDAVTEIRLKIVRRLEDSVPIGDD